LFQNPNSDNSNSDNQIDYDIDYPRGDLAFHPLECNKRLDNDPCITPWSKFFGNQLVFSSTVEIPCGKCVVMYPVKTKNGLRQPLQFPGGLRVLGKLVIHSNDILTASILVHGELVIESMKPIDGVPDVSITWMDTDTDTTGSSARASNQTLWFRTPPEQVGADSFFSNNNNNKHNNEICGGEWGACGMGRKPFVVAGGKLDIRGLPSPSMPTWVPIYDVDHSGAKKEDNSNSNSNTQDLLEDSFLKGMRGSFASIQNRMQQFADLGRIYKPPKPGCPNDDVLIHHDYLVPDLGDVFGSAYGSTSEWTKTGGLKITHRTHSQHCPVIDLKHVRNCLEADKQYILTAKVLLTRDNTVEPSDCAKGIGDDDASCMSVYEVRMSNRGIGRTSSLWKERRSFQSVHGEETTLAIDFNFTTQQLSDKNIYEILQLRGPGPGVDMELLEFTLRAPPRETFPEPEHVCKDLVPGNGNAEILGLSPYPFRTTHVDAHLSVVTEGSNHYFEVTGRRFAVRGGKKKKGFNTSIKWDVPSACLSAGARYTFHADTRMHSLADPVSSEWKIKAYFSEKKKRPITKTVAVCPSAMGTWASCDGVFEVPKAGADDSFDGANRVEVFLETDAASYAVDYDVDNLSFALVERSLDRVILPKSIENLWNAGSEILISSHTPNWDGHQTRRITSVENHDEEGYVVVLLNEAIDHPLTIGSHPFYATEVALLSRNIVFHGGGGNNAAHLTILKTPGRDQVVQGVEFLGFGQEGVPRSHPIHFDSCGDNPNSVVSKNTIRESDHRCVVIEDTNGVLVEGNVAFGNKGHCFVVETGTEVGNVFKSNLGAFCQKAKAKRATTTNDDTDTTPAVFSIASPSNHWVGNVASGSEGSGFWFHFQDQRSKTQNSSSNNGPHRVPLNEFRDNVAHSTDEESLKITGYNPTETASIVNFKSYLTNTNKEQQGRGHVLVSSSSNVGADETVMDTPLPASRSFPMRGTTIIPLESVVEDEGEEDYFDIFTSNNNNNNIREDAHFLHQASVSNPTDVFNLQSSPSLLE